MSDTYDELDSYYDKCKRRHGGSLNRHGDVPQQDFGKFSDMGDGILEENSPEKKDNDVFREYDDNGKCGG